VAAIATGHQDCLFMGNLDAKRDWGHAKDYVDAMWRILQQDTPEDFVIATGVTTKVREFISMAFAEAGILIEFEGHGLQEKGIVVACANEEFQLPIGKQIVSIDPNYFRPTEVDLLVGDATKARTKLGWEPQYDLKMLVQEMMAADLKKVDTFSKVGVEQIYSYINRFEER
jgi:GDPmannose 4,6-dehydratase